MYVEIEFPDLSPPSATIADYGVRHLFIGSQFESSEVDALVRTFLRLVEAAALDYIEAGVALKKFWDTHNGTDLRSANLSVSRFESCVSCMHRAVNVYRRLRSHKAQDPVSAHLAVRRPDFAKDLVAGQIRRLRDEVHHMEEMLVNGHYDSGLSVALRPNGPEVPHPTEPGQTILRVNRLEIGMQQVGLERIATWLREMLSTAEHLAAYRREEKAPAP